jgi:UDP-N-acetylmuramate--alanine ligase
LTYSRSDNRADIYASNIRIENFNYVFDVTIKENVLRDVVLNMGGMHNIENIVAAIGVAVSLGIENEKIKKSVESFRGIKRRFEYIISPAENVTIGGKGVIIIDDYAHHPQELKALIHGVKTFFHGSKCVIIFQPHLYSRTKDFANDFAESLDMADEVILLPIYPARELPMEGVSSELIARYMKNENRLLLDKDQLLEWIKKLKKDKRPYTHGRKILITAGAGDIDTLIDPIKRILKEV